MRSPAMGGRVGHCKISDRLHLGPWPGMKHDWGWRHYKLKLNEVRDFTLFSVLFFSPLLRWWKKFRLNYLSDSAHQRITNNECAVYMYTQLLTHTHTRMQMFVSRIYAQWQKCISIFQHRRRRLRRQKIYVKSQLNIFISRLQRGWVIALFTALRWRMLKLKPSFNLPRTTQATWLHSTWLECPAPQLIHTPGSRTVWQGAGVLVHATSVI